MSKPPAPIATSSPKLPPWPPQAVPVRLAGWSESSWDLACGLTVLEGLPADASLAEWLGASLLSPALSACA